jgi:hypothetical protein
MRTVWFLCFILFQYEYEQCLSLFDKDPSLISYVFESIQTKEEPWDTVLMVRLWLVLKWFKIP